MATVTTTITTGRATGDDITLAIMSAVVKFRNLYWSAEYMRMPAIEADRRVEDVIGLRWFKATAGGKRAARLLLDEFWPETRGMPERARFIRAVRESALGRLR